MRLLAGPSNSDRATGAGARGAHPCVTFTISLLRIISLLQQARVVSLSAGSLAAFVGDGNQKRPRSKFTITTAPTRARCLDPDQMLSCAFPNTSRTRCCSFRFDATLRLGSGFAIAMPGSADIQPVRLLSCCMAKITSATDIGWTLMWPMPVDAMWRICRGSTLS